MFYAQRIVCYAEMELAAARHAYSALHEKAQWHDGTFTSWAEERSESHPYRYDDGVTIFVADADHDPGDEFTSEVDARPSASTPQAGQAPQGQAASE
jgi:hypothetical protein